MSTSVIEVERRDTAVLTDERIEVVLRQLDFSVTGPRPDTYRMDVVACSCSSSCSGGRPRAPK